MLLTPQKACDLGQDGPVEAATDNAFVSTVVPATVFSKSSVGRKYQDEDGSYQLPNDGPEHDRLDAQSASIIALMGGKPFHAPVRQPKRILDIGCGTGVMTNILASAYPGAQVIGVDIAPVPDSRHTKLANVEYVQGDIRELLGKDPRFQLGSFDYIFERLLVFGMTDWQGFITSVATLLAPGGWLESQEASMQLLSSANQCLSNDWWWYQHLLADSRDIGIDIEIPTKLKQIFSGTPLLEDVSESLYSFSPKPRVAAPQLVGLEGEIQPLFSLVVEKISRQKRSKSFVDRLVEDVNAVWNRGFSASDKFYMTVVTGRRV